MRGALPTASFIGFTGTPIDLMDKNTGVVLGDYISVYDILSNMSRLADLTPKQRKALKAMIKAELESRRAT